MIAGVAALRDVPKLWDEFKAKFGREYENADEELAKFKVFVTNLESVEKLQKVDPMAKYSHLTPFADKTEMEMKKFKGLKPSLSKKFSEKKLEEKLDTSSLPNSFDWRRKGAVNPIKDQKQCGSCWAFATVQNIEGVNAVAKGELKNLSEQELVDCSGSDNGCNGGLPESAYEDMLMQGMGLERESDYAYEAVDDSCRAKQSKEIVYIDDWTSISEDEDQIAAALMKYGPLAIGINASYMQMYSGGISNPPFCDPTALDHGVGIVGFGEENGTKYWVVRNSWGGAWGEEGYYRIIRGEGKCGLNSMVTTAIVNKEKTWFV